MNANKKKPSLLLVDDSPENLDFLTGLLSEYKIRIASNGETALKIVGSQNKPDLILLDVMMPNMDGYEVIKRLKADKKTQEIPVIFLTGNIGIEEETRGLKLGAVDYITKPFSPPVMLARVKNHLTLKFTREKLEHQNKELIEVVKLKEDIENITHHDLKSPLTVIIGNSQLLMEDENISEENWKSAKYIEKAGYRILNMLNSSLDLYKMEPVDVVNLLKNIIDETSSLSANKGLKINLHINGEAVPDKQSFVITGESLLFYSIFSNLFKNACEASPQGGHVTINLYGNENYYQITIHNLGAVPVDIRDKFFNKYVSCGKKMGTGLGTYSAKLMAENMNGNIYMKSSDKKGTTITLKFKHN